MSGTCRGVLFTKEEREQGKKNPITTCLGARKPDDKGHDTSEDFTTEGLAEQSRIWALSKTDPAEAIARLESLTARRRDTCRSRNRLPEPS